MWAREDSLQADIHHTKRKGVALFIPVPSWANNCHGSNQEETGRRWRRWQSSSSRTSLTLSAGTGAVFQHLSRRGDGGSSRRSLPEQLHAPAGGGGTSGKLTASQLDLVTAAGRWLGLGLKISWINRMWKTTGHDIRKLLDVTDNARSWQSGWILHIIKGELREKQATSMESWRGAQRSFGGGHLARLTLPR